MLYVDRLVIFLDVLGFKILIKESGEKVPRGLATIVWLLKKTESSFKITYREQKKSFFKTYLL